MTTNTNTTKLKTYLTHAATLGSMAAMLVATSCSMVEHVDHTSHRMVLAVQPIYAAQSASIEHVSEDSVRRGGREEIHHRSASFGAIKRSHGITGTF